MYAYVFECSSVSYLWLKISLPVPKCATELIQHVVQLHLQVVQYVTGLGVHLQRGRHTEAKEGVG